MGRDLNGTGKQASISGLIMSPLDSMLELIDLGKELCVKYEREAKLLTDSEIHDIVKEWHPVVKYYSVTTWVAEHGEKFLKERPWMTPEVLDWLKTFTLYFKNTEALWKGQQALLHWLYYENGGVEVYTALRGQTPSDDNIKDVGLQNVINRLWHLKGEEELFYEYCRF